MEKESKEEFDEKVDPKFKRAHNLGFFLAEVEPELAQDFADVNSDALVMRGFKAGKEEFERQQRNRDDKTRPDWLEEGKLSKTFNKKDVQTERGIESARDLDEGGDKKRPDWFQGGYLTDTFNERKDQPPPSEDRTEPEHDRDR